MDRDGWLIDGDGRWTAMNGNGWRWTARWPLTAMDSTAMDGEGRLNCDSTGMDEEERRERDGDGL